MYEKMRQNQNRVGIIHQNHQFREQSQDNIGKSTGEHEGESLWHDTLLNASSLGLTKTQLQYMPPFRKTSCADID